VTLDQERKDGFIELAPQLVGFAVLWHVGGSVTNVAESDDFAAILQGIPLVRGLH